MRLEGWAAKVNLAGQPVEIADHTWVYSPENRQYFDCWGDHGGQDTRRIVGGYGSYNRANCYRCSVWPFPDTAGIGIYAVDGVCHQSTNCFLYTAGVTLNFNVRGYWFSLFSYGTYGRSFLRWLVAPYGYCSWAAPYRVAARGMAPDAEGDMDEESPQEDPTIDIVRQVHASAMAGRKARHPHDILSDEVAQVTKHHVPEVDFDQLRDIQMDYLQKKDALIARGHKEEHLAKRLDDLARQTQKRIAKRIGRERFERLMGVAPGEELGLIEPGAMGMAGVPVPPIEELEERGSDEDEEPDTDPDMESKPKR